jgi:hypothetical protein
MASQTEHFTEADATAFGEKFLAWANALSVTERRVLATVLEAMKSGPVSAVQGYAINLGGLQSGSSEPSQHNVPIASGNSGGTTGGGSGGGPVFRIALPPAAPSPLPIPYPVWG